LTPSLNIAALTKRTGVPPDTIRKWEQRYRVLRPERTAGGQRRYSEVDVARVEWLKARLEEGYRIGEAAALLGEGALVAGTPAELRDAFSAAATASDVNALVTVVDQTLALGALDQAFEHVLAPALADVGDRWARGELTVAQEHLASSTVRAALQRLLADARASVRGVVVLACAPGERHEIGLLMLAVRLRADGWQVAYLGPDTPIDDAVSLARDLDASVLGFSATGAEYAKGLHRGLRGVKVPSTITVVVGGAAGGETDAAGWVTKLRALAA
jgi:methanogenic corrinoid protein MtbC1